MAANKLFFCRYANNPLWPHFDEKFFLYFFVILMTLVRMISIQLRMICWPPCMRTAYIFTTVFEESSILPGPSLSSEGSYFIRCKHI